MIINPSTISRTHFWHSSISLRNSRTWVGLKSRLVVLIQLFLSKQSVYWKILWVSCYISVFSFEGHIMNIMFCFLNKMTIWLLMTYSYTLFYIRTSKFRPEARLFFFLTSVEAQTPFFSFFFLILLSFLISVFKETLIQWKMSIKISY